MDAAGAGHLRQMVREVSDAVEARIRGEAGSSEQVRRATQKLQVEGMGSGQYWTMQLFQPLTSVCLVMAQEMRLLPVINESLQAVTAEEISRKVDGNSQLIARIMRVLTGVGIGEEIGKDTFKSNELSEIAASRIGQAGIKINNEELFPIAARLVPYMREKGFHQFPKRPQEMDPVEYTHGKTMWEYWKENSELKDWFDTLMAENRRFNMPWYEIYPAAEELGSLIEKGSSDTLLIDVGGNRGLDIMEFRQKYPEIPGRFILQDLPETISQVDASSLHGVEPMEHNFFSPQPVKGAKCYFWRWVLHDFSDVECRQMLSNNVKAMDTDSRLLIQELVLPDIGVDFKSSHLDILMMLFHSGMERSESQWRALIDSVGLEIVKIWTNPNADPSVIETRLKAK